MFKFKVELKLNQKETGYTYVIAKDEVDALSLAESMFGVGNVISVVREN